MKSWSTTRLHGCWEWRCPKRYGERQGARSAPQYAVQDLSDDVDVLLFLLASRYEVDSELNDLAGTLFNSTPPGWPRVQAICNFVHQHIRFDYMQTRANRTAWEALRERTGVCRDYVHLAITLHRCMNTPARCCTRLSRRHRRAAGAVSDGFWRLVRSLPGRTMVRLRPS
jgi:transglutaminase-like putative cysteine protease